MSRLSPIQDSFQTGFIGRRVRGRTSIDAYKNGLGVCNNWQPLVQGPIKLRNGSKYITGVDPSNWVSGQVGVEGLRSFTFQRGLDNDVIVEIGDTNGFFPEPLAEPGQELDKQVGGSKFYIGIHPVV